MKALKVLISVFASLSVIFSVFFVVVYIDFFERDVKSKYITSHFSEKDNYQPSMWLFNGIDVDSKGNLYIACDNAVLVYNQNGKCIGSVHVPSNVEKTAFKIDKNQLIIISDTDIEGFSSSNYTYEMKYDLDFDEKQAEDGIPEYNYKHKQSFSGYKEKNRFEKKESVEYNGLTYSYDFYGKVSVSDGTTINLNVSLWPIPFRFIVIPIIVCVAITLILIICIKKK